MESTLNSSCAPSKCDLDFVISVIVIEEECCSHVALTVESEEGSKSWKVYWWR